MLAMRDALYVSDDNAETTFKYDELVPSLPLPSLEQSVARVLNSVQPLCGDGAAAFDEVKAKASRFVSDERVVKAQSELERLAQSSKNWAQQYWLEYAYLRARKPLVPFSSMSLPMPLLDSWRKETQAFNDAFVANNCKLDNNAEQLDVMRANRASMAMFFKMQIYKLLLFEKMRPMVHRNERFTMQQLRHLFVSTRVPGRGVDLMQSSFESNPQGLFKRRPASHFLVLYRGYVFAADSLIVTQVKPSDGSTAAQYEICVRPAPQILEQLEHIRREYKNKPLGPGVAALTTGQRDDWAEARAQLRRFSSKNSELCDKVESAINVLVLDDAMPLNATENFKHCLLGEPSNKWTDKSMHMIAFRNGAFGGISEHSGFDGFCGLVLTNFLVMSLRACEGKWSDELNDELWSSQAEAVKSKIPMPELLEFDLDDSLMKSIAKAKTNFVELNTAIDASEIEFKLFGKERMKACKIHPEAFMQCAVHLAYYRLHKKIAPTYVTASTRRYYNGRTETIRSCCPEMLTFLQTIDGPDANMVAKCHSLHKAATSFTILMNDASFGKGCDRHMLALYLTTMKLFPDAQIDLFEDRYFQQSNYFLLSTSCVGYWNYGGGVPPIVDDGYGCFYGIADDSVTIGMTAYKNADTNLENFSRELQTAMIDIEKLAMGCQQAMKNKL